MTKKQRAAALLAAAFGLGAIIGAAVTNAVAEPETVPVWMPQVHYTVIRENEVEVVEEATVEEEPVETVKTEHLGEFKLTAYCTCAKCCGKWADGVTASGTEATVGRTIAVDPDVIPIGTTVYINGYKYVAEDTGSGINGNRIDILFPSHSEALKFGVQYADVSIVKK